MLLAVIYFLDFIVFVQYLTTVTIKINYPNIFFCIITYLPLLEYIIISPTYSDSFILLCGLHFYSLTALTTYYWRTIPV